MESLGYGLGRGRGVGLGLEWGVGLGLGLTVGLGVAVAVGVLVSRQTGVNIICFESLSATNSQIGRFLATILNATD